METAIYSTVGLMLVSVLSGLAYLAVRYPETYGMLGEKLLFGFCALALAALGFSIGLGTASSVAQTYIDPDRIAPFLSAIDRIQSGSSIIGLATLAFCGFLWLLAKIGADIYRHDRRKNRKDDEGE